MERQREKKKKISVGNSWKSGKNQSSLKNIHPWGEQFRTDRAIQQYNM